MPALIAGHALNGGAKAERLAPPTGILYTVSKIEAQLTISAWVPRIP
jgi:hypothetical protein